MHSPKWSLFFDFHTHSTCPDVGERFDVEAFADKVREAGVDFLTFHARCNMGMAYYDTKIGIKHPSLKRDLFGELAAACAKRKIALSAYFNGGLSHEEAYRRRDWAALSPDGRMYHEGFEQPRGAFCDYPAFIRQMCYNTGYGDHLVAMVEEVTRNYPVSGVFIDCFGPRPCIGVECMKEMKEKGIDWRDGKQLQDFARFSNLRLMSRIAAAAKALRPELLMYFNGVAYENQDKQGTYLECECLPTGSWGYELLPIRARYMRTLGKPVLNMTGRFHLAWGDFGGIRKPAGVKYDCVYGLANGMRPNIGCHAHPRGDINKAVFSLVNEVYTDIRRYEPWFEGAAPVVDLAVVTPTGRTDPSHSPPVRGATRMLCETRHQFDVVNTFCSWDAYKLLVLPDDVRLEGEVGERVRRHLDAGKPVLSSWRSGMDMAGSAFVFKEWGLDYLGECPYDPAYMEVAPQWAEGLPEMWMALYGKCLELKPHEGVETLAHVVAPYYNEGWDGEHGYCYTPPDKVTSSPAAVLAAQVGHFSWPLFEAYHQCAAPFHRELLAKCLARLFPDPLLKDDNLPSYARATVTAQPGRWMVHLMSYLPERRGQTMQIIEEPIVLRDVSFSLRLEGRSPRGVYLAPGKAALAYATDGDYLRITVPEVNGYAMAVVEF